LNGIDLTLSSYVGYVIAIGLVAIAVVVFFFRRSNERQRKSLATRRGYNCLSSKMAWGSDDDNAEEQKQDRGIAGGNS
jgi:streptomycin 6-kinase